jgi:hypothetical protein
MFFSINASAARDDPREVPPVDYKGVRYAAAHWLDIGKFQGGGLVQAGKIASGKLLWRKTIYTIDYDEHVEKDVQDVFIVSMKIENDRLVVENERGGKYELDPKTGEVTTVEAMKVPAPCPPTVSMIPDVLNLVAELFWPVRLVITLILEALI